MADVHSVEIREESAVTLIKDYDPVAYFAEGCPTPGHFDLSVTYHGEKYLFATAANRDAFEANPRKYVLRHGG